MLSNWRGRSGEATSSSRGAGLKFMALAASISLMLIGFGAAAASPATADDGGSYKPLCAEGYHFDSDTSMCVKKDLVEKTDPTVTYVGNCDFVREDALAEEGVDIEVRPVWGPWVFDTDTGMCNRVKTSGPGPNTQTHEGNITDTIRTCDNGWTLKNSGELVSTEHSTPPPVEYWCERTTTFDPQDPTCREGDTLVPAPVGTPDREQKGARCYTPKKYCEFTDGQWINTGKADSVENRGDRETGFCFYESDGTYCSTADAGASFVAATFTLKYSDDRGSPSTANHPIGVFYTDPPEEFNAADIVPVIPNPIDADNPVNPGQNLADGGQAFLDRGCLPEPVVPVTPAGGPTPVKDFCPNLDGVQWENYDCNTPVAVAAAEVAVPAPAEVVPPAEVVAPVEAATVPEAETVVAPEAATVPAAVPAGDGSQAPSVPRWALAMIAEGVLGAAGAGRQLVGARK